MPSTTSSWVSRPFASSTVITPSLPTFSIASAIMSPMVLSPFADTAPTWAISSLPLVDFDCFLSSSTTVATARSMPRLRFIGSCPAATILAPSVKMERASTVAVVVPSPATSEVLDATSFTIWAPMFSNLSSSSTSLATVTPSLVTLGAPKDLSNTTFLPLGPKVTVTASANTLTPLRIASRASRLNLTILAAIKFLLDLLKKLFLNDAEDIFLAHDQMLFTVHVDFCSSIFAEKHTIVDFDIERGNFAVLVRLPFADRYYFPFLRFFFCGVGNDKSPLGFLFLLDAFDNDPILQRSNLHLRSPFKLVELTN